MTIIESKTLDLIEEILESNVECKLHVEARELRDSILQSNNLANLEMIFIEPSYFYPGIFKGQTNYKFTSSEIVAIKKESIIEGEIHKIDFIRNFRRVYSSEYRESSDVLIWLESLKVVLFEVAIGEVDFPEGESIFENNRGINRGGDSFDDEVDMGGCYDGWRGVGGRTH